MGYLGDTLRDARLTAGYTQREAARLTGMADTSGSYLGDMECGRRKVPQDLLLALTLLYSGLAAVMRCNANSGKHAVQPIDAKERVRQLTALLANGERWDGYGSSTTVEAREER